jgi:hypothetical protein
MAEESRDFVQELTSILIKHKAITQQESEDLVHDFKVSPKSRFDYFLLEEGLVEKDDLLRALSEYYGVPYFDVEGFFFNHDLLNFFPLDFLERKIFIPIELEGNIITVVASDPDDDELRQEIGEYVPQVVEFRVGLRRDIINAIREFYDKSERALEQEEQEKAEDEKEFGLDDVELMSSEDEIAHE